MFEAWAGSNVAVVLVAPELFSWVAEASEVVGRLLKQRVRANNFDIYAVVYYTLFIAQ